MRKLKINQNNSLKRVLSVEEMKSICGGMNASITCTCTLHLFYAHEPTLVPRTEEPTGAFSTRAECEAGCNTTCQELYKNNCRRVEAHYNYQGGYGSDSGSE